ncbi:MAG: hypothetical protein HYX69_14125 [Planctomycetia bacterium]|nr:hypothetical protein [Planctomycetia bacterium]
MRRRLLHALRCALVCGCFISLAAASTVAWGQAGVGGAGAPSFEKTEGVSYVFPYFIVAIAIGFGIFCVARSSRREDPQAKDGGPV